MTVIETNDVKFCPCTLILCKRQNILQYLNFEFTKQFTDVHTDNQVLNKDTAH